MRWIVRGSVLAGVIGTMLVARGGDVTGAASMPVVDQRMVDILGRLASGDFAARENAQHDLEQIPWQQRAMLVRVADAQGDAEVKARLAARILQIDEQLAVDPPAIALHLKKATLQEAAAALRDQMGMDVTFAPLTGAPLELITLDTQGAFWDVYGELSKLNVGRMAITKDSRTILNIGPLRVFDRHWGFAVLPQALVYTQQSNPQAAAGAELMLSRLTMQLTVVADPRIKVISAAAPRVTWAVDELGNNLLKNPVVNVAMQESAGRVAGWTSSTELTMPAKRGKLLAVKGEGRFELQVSEMRQEVTEIEKHLNEPVAVGNQMMTVLQFQAQNNQISMAVRIMPTDRGSSVRGVEMSLVDGNGLTVWTSLVNGQMGTTIGVQRPGPYKLVAVFPERTKTVTVPFELKDIVLPGGGG